MLLTGSFVATSMKGLMMLCYNINGTQNKLFTESVDKKLYIKTLFSIQLNVYKKSDKELIALTYFYSF